MLGGAVNPYPVLTSVREALAAVEGVRTCKIGMEASITPDDYPLVRLVPTKLEEGVARGQVNAIETLVYFGLAVHEFEGGLEALYEQLFARWVALMDAMRRASAVHSVQHLETILDEDRNEAFKLLAIRVRITG